jgi:hypothetical protein
MRAFQIAPGGAGAPALLPSADDGLVDVAASPAAAAGPIEATTSIYSSHAQRVTFVVVADVEAALTAGGGPIGICAPDRPGALTTRVLEGSLPQGIQPLVVRLAAPGRFAVRARAARVLVELPPWQAPA